MPGLRKIDRVPTNIVRKDFADVNVSTPKFDQLSQKYRQRMLKKEERYQSKSESAGRALEVEEFVFCYDEICVDCNVRIWLQR